MLKNKYKTTALYLASERPILEIKEPTKPESFRLLKILSLLFRAFRKTKFGKASDQVKGIAWRSFFEDMGGLWVKFGQLLAMRTDLYEKDFTRELAKLHFRVNAFPTSYAIDAIELSIGNKIDAVFSEFEETPIAAASLAQVHTARLIRSGKKVAIKVQRPYAQEYLESDMKLIKSIFKFFQRFEAFEPVLLDDMFWELETMLKEEIDFRYEINNLKESKKRFKKYNIYVPKVFKKLSSEKVVVMEYIHGVTMSEYIFAKRNDPQRLKLWEKRNKIKPKKVGGFLLRNVWRQVLEDNFFHGDLQPGNIMLLAKSKLAFIDLGSVGSTDEDTLSFYRQQLIAIGKKQYSKAAELSMLTSPNIPAENLNKIRYSIVKGLRGALLKASLIDVDIEDKTTVHNASNDMNKELAKYKVSVNWGLLKLIRTFLTIDPSIVNLSPKIDIQKEWLRFYKDAKWRVLKSKVKSLINLPGYLSDHFEMIQRIERKRAIDYKASVSKAVEPIIYFFKVIKLSIIILFFFLAGTYFYQKFGLLSSISDSQNWLTSMVKSIPQFTHFTWMLVLLLLLFVINKHSKLINKLKEPQKSFHI